MIYTVEFYDEPEAFDAIDYLMDLGFHAQKHERVKYWVNVQPGNSGLDVMYDLPPVLDEAGFRWDWV